MIADAQVLILEGLTKLLESRFEIVGVAEDGPSLISTAKAVEPDVILLEIDLPLLNGFEAMEELRRLMPRTKLVVVTARNGPAVVAQCFRAGCSGIVSKQSCASELIRAIERVRRSQSKVTVGVTKPSDEVVPELQDLPGLLRLTDRQREVLQLVADGRSNKEIAYLLKVSIKTVEFHKFRLMTTLGLRSTADLTRYAIRNGVVGL